MAPFTGQAAWKRRLAVAASAAARDKVQASGGLPVSRARKARYSRFARMQRQFRGFAEMQSFTTG